MFLCQYNESFSEIWNNFVDCSRNGTFLFNRHFMDYHKERYVDCSLLFFSGDENKKKKLLGVFPASAHGEKIISHAGLTYGGLILSSFTHAVDVQEMLDLTILYYKEKGYNYLIVKPIPYIYHLQPSDDELYWLFRKNAQLSSRSLSTAINLSSPLPFSSLRKRKVSSALKAGCQVNLLDPNKKDQKDPSNSFYREWKLYWQLLDSVLHNRHNTHPVHTLNEILQLQQEFPDKIVLATVKDKDNKEILAGTVLFCTTNVVHAQYLASSDVGREIGALDLLLYNIIESLKNTSTCFVSPSPQYFDFGISTENGGKWLNEGLNFQKEGFGGRSVVYDSYKISLN